MTEEEKRAADQAAAAAAAADAAAAGQEEEPVVSPETEALEDEVLQMTEADLADPVNQDKVKQLQDLQGVQSLIHQKRHHAKKRGIAEGRVKELEGGNGGETSPAPAPNRAAPKPVVPGAKPALPAGLKFSPGDIAIFRLDHPEVSPVEMEEIRKYAESTNQPLEKAIASPIMKAFIDQKRGKQETDEARPHGRRGTGSPTIAPGQKNAWDLTPEEFEAKRARIIQQGRGGQRR